MPKEFDYQKYWEEKKKRDEQHAQQKAYESSMADAYHHAAIDYMKKFSTPATQSGRQLGTQTLAEQYGALAAGTQNAWDRYISRNIGGGLAEQGYSIPYTGYQNATRASAIEQRKAQLEAAMRKTATRAGRGMMDAPKGIAPAKIEYGPRRGSMLVSSASRHDLDKELEEQRKAWMDQQTSAMYDEAQGTRMRAPGTAEVQGMMGRMPIYRSVQKQEQQGNGGFIIRDQANRAVNDWRSNGKGLQNPGGETEEKKPREVYAGGKKVSGPADLSSVYAVNGRGEKYALTSAPYNPEYLWTSQPGSQVYEHMKALSATSEAQSDRQREADEALKALHYSAGDASHLFGGSADISKFDPSNRAKNLELVGQYSRDGRYDDYTKYSPDLFSHTYLKTTYIPKLQAMTEEYKTEIRKKLDAFLSEYTEDDDITYIPGHEDGKLIYDLVNGEGAYDAEVENYRQLAGDDPMVLQNFIETNLISEAAEMWEQIRRGTLPQAKNSGTELYAAQYYGNLLEDAKELDEQLTALENAETGTGAMTAFNQSDADKIYRAITEDGYAQALDAQMAVSGSGIGDDWVLGKNGFNFIQMTESEKDTYRNLYDNQGAGAAMAYMDALNNSALKRREKEQETEGALAFADVAPVTASATARALNVAGTPLSLIGMAGMAFGLADKDSRLFDATRIKTQLDSAVGAKVAELIPQKLLGTTVGQILYGSVTSFIDNLIAQNMATGLVGMPAGEVTEAVMKSWQGKVTAAVQVIMSSEATASTFVQNIDSGMDFWHASLNAITDGLVEAATEKWSVEALFSDKTKLYTYLMRNVFSEGAEEVAGNLASLVTDAFTKGQGQTTIRANAQELLNQTLSERGLDAGALSKEELDDMFADCMRQAAQNWLKEEGQAFVSGALAGGMGGGVDYAAGWMTGVSHKNQQRKAVNNTANALSRAGADSQQQLLKAAAMVKGDTNYHAAVQQAQEQADNGQRVDAKTFRQIVKGIVKTGDQTAARVARRQMSESVKAELQAGLKQGAVYSDQVLQDAAGGIVELTTGKGKPTYQQKEAMQLVPGALDLVNDITSVRKGNAAEEQKARVAKIDGSITAGIVSDPEMKQQRTAEKAINVVLGNIKARDAVSTNLAEGILADDQEMAALRGKAKATSDDAVISGEGGKEYGQLLRREGDQYVVKVGGKERKVDLADMQVGDRDTAAVITYGQRYGKQVSESFENTLLQAVRGGNVSDVDSFISNAYRIRTDAFIAAGTGRNSFSARGMDEKTAQTVFNASLEDAKKAEAKRVEGIMASLAVKPGEGKIALNGIESTNTKEYTKAFRKLTTEQQQQVAAVGSLYRQVGLNVAFVQMENSNVYGSYNARTNTVEINLNGKNVRTNLQHSMLVTAGHEMTHFLESNSAEGYAALRRVVMDMLAEKGADINALARRMIENRSAQGEELTINGAIAEIIADSCDQILTNGKIIDQIAESNPELYKGIRGWAEKFVGRIRKAITGSKDSASVYSRYLEDSIDKIADAWGVALDEAKNTEKNGILRGLGDGHDKSVKYSMADREDAAYQQAVKKNDTAEMERITGYGTSTLAKAAGAVTETGTRMYSYASMESDYDAYRTMMNGLVNDGVMEQREVDDLFATIDEAMKIIGEDDYSRSVLDLNEKEGKDDRAFSPVKPNSDNLYKVSVDFSTLCRKRLLQQVIQAQIETKYNTVMTKAERVAMRNALKQLQAEGKRIEIACALCYVESARLKSPEQISKFLNDREAALIDYFGKKNKMTTKEINEHVRQMAFDFGETKEKTTKNGTTLVPKSLKEMSAEHRDAIRAWKHDQLKNYDPTAEEKAMIKAAKSMDASMFKTSDGLAKLKKTYPKVYDAFVTSVRNATQSKGIEADVAYWHGDTDSIGDNLIKQMNAQNGLRTQSWSDFQVTHILDYMGAIMDLSARNAKMHGYTKVGDYVRLMGKTGQMINMSLIPADYFGQDLNSAEAWDRIEGIDWEEMLQLRNDYPDTAGNIAIGIKDDQIRALLGSDLIDYVIPYHRSSMDKATRVKIGLKNWDEYESKQNEKEHHYDGEVKDANYHNKPSFNDWFSMDEARAEYESQLEGISDPTVEQKYAASKAAMRKMAQKYIELCHSRGLQEKFVDFSSEEGYWKLLVDRKMINNKTGELIEQKAVRPVFDQIAVEGILRNELERVKTVQPDIDAAAEAVMDMWKRGEIQKAAGSKEVRNEVEKFDNWVAEQVIRNAAEENDAAGNFDEKYGDAKYSRADSDGNDLSEGQQKYFADSKVRDDENRLIRVYHATDNNFTVFDRNMLGYGTDRNAMDVALAATSHVGFFFNTNDIKKITHQKNSMSGYLNIKNPYYVGSLERLADEIVSNYGEDYNTLQEKFDDYDFSVTREMGESFRDWLESNGYDGIVFEDEEMGGTTYAALYENQFKEAGNLNPTENQDIRYSRADEDDISVHDFMSALDEEDLTTDAEKRLLKDWQEKQNTVTAGEEKIRAWNAVLEDENASADEKRKARINIGTERNRISRTLDEISRIESSDGYAGMMKRGLQALRMLDGKDGAEVLRTTNAMINRAEESRREIQEVSKNLRTLAGDPATEIARSYFKKSDLSRTAGELIRLYDADVPNGMVENQLAGIMLGLVSMDKRKGADALQACKDLAGLIIDNRKGSDNVYLQMLRGMTFTLSAEQLAELKSRDITLKSLRSDLAGTGIRFVKGTVGTDANWQEICDEFPMLDRDLNDRDQPLAILDLVDELRRQESAEYKDHLNDVAADVLDYATRLLPSMPDDPAVKTQIRNLFGVLTKMSEGVTEAAGQVAKMQTLIGGLKSQADAIFGADEQMRAGIENAKNYYAQMARMDMLTQHETEMQQLADRLSSKAAKDAMAQREEFERKLAADRQVRNQRGDNELTQKKIRTATQRLANLVFAETDLKNVPEEYKSAVRFLLRKIAGSDSVEGRTKLGFTDRKSRERAVQILDALDARDGNKLDLDGIMDPEIKERISDDLMNLEYDLDSVFSPVKGNTQLENLQARGESLKRVQQAVSDVLNIVRAAGNAFIQGKNVRVQDLADEVRNDMPKRAKAQWNSNGISEAERFAGWGNLTPVYFFKRLANNGLKRVWSEFERAENEAGKFYWKAKNRVQQISDAHGAQNWNMEETRTLELFNGGKIEMTRGQLMSLYATAKREAATGPQETRHLTNGGIVLEDRTQKKKLGKTASTDVRATRLTGEDLMTVTNLLTEEERNYVDDVVGFMSGDLSSIGNAASLRMYGIKKFNEKYYFPYKTWDGVRNKSSDTVPGSSSENRAVHQGFTKNLTHGAGTPLVIGDFNETVTQHMAGMVSFATNGEALENLNRVLNQRVTYDDDGRGHDVNDPGIMAPKRTLETELRYFYGKNAMDYLRTWMSDANGGIKQDNRKAPKEFMLSLFRKNAVAGSLSVAAQQPLSYIRAGTMISPKYLAQAMPKGLTNYKENWNEMREHSGVAVIKQMGRFDMNYGKTAARFIMPDGYQTTLHKIGNQISEKATILPEVMDNVTWSAMWQSVKYEQADLHPEMDVTSDEFLDMVGERFNDVMRKTQVYDSVLVRSANMRSQKYTMKAATSFMAEPTLTANLLADAWHNRNTRGGKANMARASAAFVISAAAQAAIKAIMGAGRKPDEDKTLTENFLNRLAYNYIGEVNPLNLVPFYSDLVDMFAGNDIKDDSLGMVKTLMNAFDQTLTPNFGSYEWYENTVGQICQLFTGLPAKNLMRDARALYNLMLNGKASYAQRPTSANVLKYQFVDTLMGTDLIGAVNSKLKKGYKTTNGAYYKRMQEAFDRGDMQTVDDIVDYMLNGKGVNESKVNTELRGIYNDSYSDAMESGDAERALELNGQMLERGLINEDTAKTNERKVYKNGLDEAIRQNRSEPIGKAVQSMLDSGMKKGDVTTWLTNTYKEEYLSLPDGSAEKVKLRNAIELARKAAGYDQKSTEKWMKGWK